MAENLSRHDLMTALARIEAGLADASYRMGRLRQGDRKSREIAAVSINIQGARSDVVALMQLIDDRADTDSTPDD
jgi:hypothetical protein